MAGSWTPPAGHPISESEAKRLTAGPLSRVYREIVMNCCRAIYWFRYDDPNIPILNSGTITFLETPKMLLGLTAAHVLRGYEADKAAYPIRLQIGDVVVNDVFEHIVQISDRLDIATLMLKPTILPAMGKDFSPLRAWPPLVPQEGRGIVLGGFPGVSRDVIGRAEVSFGLFTALGVARVVTDEQITWALDRNFLVTDHELPQPPPNCELGGISGGPLISMLETENHLSHYRISGLISQASAGLENIVAKRIDFVRDDGSIYEPDWLFR